MNFILFIGCFGVEIEIPISYSSANYLALFIVIYIQICVCMKEAHQAKPFKREPIFMKLICRKVKWARFSLCLDFNAMNMSVKNHLSILTISVIMSDIRFINIFREIQLCRLTVSFYFAFIIRKKNRM